MPEWAVVGWARSHQTAAFFLVTFVFSWAFWIPSAFLFVGVADSDALITTPWFVALQTLGAVGPSVAAVGLARVLHGRGAVRALLDRFRPRRPLMRFYVVAAALAPALTVLAMSLDFVLFDRPFVDADSGLAEMAAEMGWFGAVAMLPVVLFSQLFTSPLLEEAGWRGFALPRMQAGTSALTASLRLGPCGACGTFRWSSPTETRSAPYLAGIMAYTTLMTAVFNGAGGNLFSMLLFHGSLNLSLNVLLPLRAGWTPALVAWAAVLFVMFRYGSMDLAGQTRYTGPDSDGAPTPTPDEPQATHHGVPS